jgi:glycosyltransferase involved in cell wall biosynthesis
MYTFIAEYPDEAKRIGGELVRYKEIDGKYKKFDRQYLDIKIFRYWNEKTNSISIDSKCKVYKYNFFKHFFHINKRLKESQFVYVHTLYNYIKIWIQVLVFFPKKQIALDLHGVVPEELSFQKNKMLSVVYSFIELMAFVRVNCFIHVTHSMKQFYNAKYKKIYKKRSINDVVYGVLPQLVHNNIDTEKVNQLRKKYNIDDDSIVFIYSGGTQKWQNIPLMLSSIKKLISTNNNYKFILLSNENDTLTKELEKLDITKNVIVDRALSTELGAYYELAHYGFVLRDDHIVNRVSNPTKLSEYLAFGITPIVKCKDIGDYLSFGYNYIQLNNISNSLNKLKSSTNQEIFKSYYSKNKNVKLPFN